MPICLNCEIELPAGTEICPHCNEPVEEEIETDAGGGILADAWDDEPLSFSESEPDDAPLEDLPAAEPEDEPEPEPEPMPAAAPALEEVPAEPDDAAAERARRRAERAAKREKSETRSGDTGTGKRERAGKGDRAAKAGKGKSKTRESKPLTPAKDPTLSQPRRVVAFAAWTWMLFVLLYAGAFTKGLLWGDEAAAKANMANVMFGVLGLTSFLFLWAHLKMGRYISFSSVIVALGVECFFFFTGKENFGGLVGTGLFFFVQVLLLTGAGGIIRGFLGFLLTLVAVVAFAVPHVVDVVLHRGAVAQEQRARALKAGELVYTKDEAGAFTQVRAAKEGELTENDQRATMPQVWAEMLKVADAFDASEQTLEEWPTSIGLDLRGWGIDWLLLKPGKREQVLVRTVVPSLFAILRGDPGDKSWGMREFIAAQDQVVPPLPPEQFKAWDELSTVVTRRFVELSGRYLAARPTSGAELPGSYAVYVQVYPFQRSNDRLEIQIVPEGSSRYMTFDNKWKAVLEAKEGDTLADLYFTQTWQETLKKVRAELEWSESEANDTFNCIRRLAVLEPTIRVETLAEAPADGAGEGGGEKPADEGGAGEGGDEAPADEGGADEGGDEKPADDGGSDDGGSDEGGSDEGGSDEGGSDEGGGEDG